MLLWKILPCCLTSSLSCSSHWYYQDSKCWHIFFFTQNNFPHMVCPYTLVRTVKPQHLSGSKLPISLTPKPSGERGFLSPRWHAALVSSLRQLAPRPPLRWAKDILVFWRHFTTNGLSSFLSLLPIDNYTCQKLHAFYSFWGEYSAMKTKSKKSARFV